MHQILMTMLQRAKKHGRKFLNPVETSVGGPDLMFKVLPLYFTNQNERVPELQLGPFVTDSSVYMEPPTNGLRITWMGHSSMLVEIDGFRVLIDPVWDERASPARWFGPKRFFAAPLGLDQLPRIDVVLNSHDHYDHLGKMTIERLARLDAAKDARWVTPLGVGGSLRQFGVQPDRIVEMDWTESLEIADGLRITALPTRHFSGRSLTNRFETLWASFVLKGSTHTIYYGADSGPWEGFAEIGRSYGPFDLTMLEIGASNPLWSDVHLGPDGAAKAFADLNAGGLLMPIHWGLFDLALHSWRQPIERMIELADQAGITLWSPAPGMPTEVISGQELRSDWWHSSR